MDSLTPKQLRREIAELTGHTLRKQVKGDKFIFTILSPGNRIIRQITVNEDTPVTEGVAWFNIPHWRIPDWTADPGAAYMLCDQIAQENRYEINVNFQSETVLFLEWEGLGMYGVVHSAPLTDNRAFDFARLAHAALKAHGADADVEQDGSGG